MGCRYGHRKGTGYRRLSPLAPLGGAQVMVPALYIAADRYPVLSFPGAG